MRQTNLEYAQLILAHFGALSSYKVPQVKILPEKLLDNSELALPPKSFLSLLLISIFGSLWIVERGGIECRSFRAQLYLQRQRRFFPSVVNLKGVMNLT